ncbi:MAG TPA: NAD-dependent epimerase/dehydratase family protein [Flavisolibacter sp.]|nr:NAD-dependent epimerase/dehydratase family protein [Flavisolibacter sp.]
MHTILGAGGPIANALTKELTNRNEPVQLVSRRPVTQFAGAEWTRADLKDSKAVMAAVRNASVIYMTAGLVYNKKVWKEEWPLIMQNLIAAAKDTGARLIFFDNVYMYGHVKGPMTEKSPYRPASVKGEVRARIATQLMEAAAKGSIRASIARAADFYGAESMNSFLDLMVLQKFASKEKALWLGDPERLHSFTYVPDAGKAMYLLGQDASSDNQVWHLPTAPALSGRTILSLAARAAGAEGKFTRVSKLMLQTLGLFKPMIAESVELYYQYRYDYDFNSSKFEHHFGLQPTAYEKGIFDTVRMFQEKKQGLSATALSR